MIDSIKNNEPAPLPSTVPLYIKQIIHDLLDKNPKNRPSAQKMIEKDEIQA